jgi:integrase
VQNLAEVEARQENAQREGTAQTADAKGKIVEFLWHLKKEGRKTGTMKNYKNFLFSLSRCSNLLDPESVKEAVALKESWSSTTKKLVTAAYKSFADFAQIKFKPPKYQQQQKIPFIPLESEIDALIAGCGKTTATLLQMLKETGMRFGEAKSLKWIDADLERGTLTLNSPEKNSNPRIFKASSKLIAMLNMLPKKNDKVFNIGWTSIHHRFAMQRKRLADKLQNPRLLRITFHTFRHWKATMEYNKTKNILHVMKLLGHKNIQNTLIYTHLVDFESEEYHSAVAKNVEEARKLVEEGFEYVCHHSDVMLFRKRK